MEYRSTNAQGRYVHFGGAVVAGAEFGSGIELNPNSSGSAANIQPVGDESNKSIQVQGKGTGGVLLGTSTSALVKVQRYLVQFTVPALSSGASAESTVTVTGLTTNSILQIQPRVPVNSTVTGVLLSARCSTADELVVGYHNVSVSSLSGSTQSAYLIQFGF